jgi:hypothetical protein
MRCTWLIKRLWHMEIIKLEVALLFSPGIGDAWDRARSPTSTVAEFKSYLRPNHYLPPAAGAPPIDSDLCLSFEWSRFFRLTTYRYNLFESTILSLFHVFKNLNFDQGLPFIIFSHWYSTSDLQGPFGLSFRDNSLKFYSSQLGMGPFFFSSIYRNSQFIWFRNF